MELGGGELKKVLTFTAWMDLMTTSVGLEFSLGPCVMAELLEGSR